MSAESPRSPRNSCAGQSRLGLRCWLECDHSPPSPPSSGEAGGEGETLSPSQTRAGWWGGGQPSPLVCPGSLWVRRNAAQGAGKLGETAGRLLQTRSKGVRRPPCRPAEMNVLEGRGVAQSPRGSLTAMLGCMVSTGQRWHPWVASTKKGGGGLEASEGLYRWSRGGRPRAWGTFCWLARGPTQMEVSGALGVSSAGPGRVAPAACPTGEAHRGVAGGPL